MEAPALLPPTSTMAGATRAVLSIPWIHKMPRATREEDRLTEDEIARRKLGPRGVPRGQDTAKMTPQLSKSVNG